MAELKNLPTKLIRMLAAGLWSFLRRLYNKCLGVNTMSKANRIASLKTLSSDLLDNTLAEIRLHRKESSPPKEKYIFVAEYLLQEAMEYVTGAFEMIESGKSNASIALSRWVLEASLNLLWTVADGEKIDERLKSLCGEALRNDACLQEGLAKMWPDKSQAFEGNAARAREMRKSLCVEKIGSLKKRLDEIEQLHEEELYTLYRVCCEAAHPSLKVWKRFSTAPNSIVSKKPIDKQSIACWMAAASAYYLVIHLYCLTGLGDSKQLKDWWENEVRPLLNGD